MKRIIKVLRRWFNPHGIRYRHGGSRVSPGIRLRS